MCATWDIAVFVDGQPLVENDGIHIGSHPTLVRALKVRSIGIGGDSAINVLGEAVRVGPNRLGPSLADSIPAGAGLPVNARPTLIDALNVTGACAHGNVDASRRGLLKLVGARRRHLAYLGRENPQRYEDLIVRLGPRRSK